jgi:methionyl-tRNA formyltransferase
MNTKPKILFLGKDKPLCRAALDLLDLESNKCEVIGVGAPKGGELSQYAASLGFATYTNKQLYQDQSLHSSVDLVISFLYPRLIKEPFISTPKLGCLNFHPAPLPRYRGVAGYARAILNQETVFGASCHYIDSSFDTGDIVEVSQVEMKPNDTSFSLEKRTLDALFTLYVKVMYSIFNNPNQKLRAVSQKNETDVIYTKLEDIDTLRTVYPDDTAETIARKARAFWFPPFPGACLTIDGTEFTLIDSSILTQLAQELKKIER